MFELGCVFSCDEVLSYFLHSGIFTNRSPEHIFYADSARKLQLILPKTPLLHAKLQTYKASSTCAKMIFNKLKKLQER